MLVDQLGRPIRDLRISVTDRCNFRCPYCMPAEIFGEGYHFLEKKELLTFEEIRRLAAIFAGLGVNKFRITGGEPLLRTDLDQLIDLAVNTDMPVVITDAGADVGVVTKPRLLRGIQGGKND